jgi:hypothetical protein
MIQAENLDHSRSVEHFIPNTLLSVPRSPRDGDFFACRKCNSKKSKIDYVLAVVARVQSPNDEVATNTLLKAVTSSKKASKKFIDMVRGARHNPDGVYMDIPIDGRDLVDYLTYLAKGQYFRKTGHIFDEQKMVAQIEFVNKPVLSALKANYKGQHWSDPILDLIKNPNSESFGKDECVIWTRESDYLFILHHYTAIMIRIRPRSRRNRARARELEWQLLRDFRTRRES